MSQILFTASDFSLDLTCDISRKRTGVKFEDEVAYNFPMKHGTSQDCWNGKDDKTLTVTMTLKFELEKPENSASTERNRSNLEKK